MADDRDASRDRKVRDYAVLAAEVVLLAAIAWVGFHTGPQARFGRSQAWLLIMGFMAGFAVLAGFGITGDWRGILIDSRRKMSLSRLQLLAWTLLVLSAIVTAALTNHAYGMEAPLSIAVPTELWVLLGISTASAVAAPAVLSSKRDLQADTAELGKTARTLHRQSNAQVDTSRSTVIVHNKELEDARWGDLLKGDEAGNAATVDLGKLQMFFFTFVLLLGYGAAVAHLFDGSTSMAALPAVDASLNTLLGISHTGYLAHKAVPHSSEVREPVAAAVAPGRP